MFLRSVHVVFVSPVVITLWCTHRGGRFTTQLLPTRGSVDWEGWIVLPGHRASGWGTTDADSWTDIQHMSLSLFLLHADNGVEGTGVLCEEKVNLIACDFWKEPPFSWRAWRAISPLSDPSLGSYDGRTEPTKPSMIHSHSGHVKMFIC